MTHEGIRKKNQLSIYLQSASYKNQASTMVIEQAAMQMQQ
jgi:hypothetical protein